MKTKSRTFPFKKQKHFVDVVHMTNDCAVVQVPNTQVQVRKLSFNLTGQRVKHQGKQQRSEWVTHQHQRKPLRSLWKR